MYKRILGILPVSLLILTSSCGEKDLYVPVDKEKETEATYESAFVAKFGAISKNQSWDFSTGKEYLGSSRSIVSSIRYEIVEGLDYSKNRDLENDVMSKVPEGTKITGDKCTLLAPDCGFYIFPMFTNTGNMYDCYVQIGTQEPIKLFSKNYGIEDNSGTFYNGSNATFLDETGKAVSSGKASMPGIYIEAPIGTPINVFETNINRPNRNYRPGVNFGTTTGHSVYIRSDKTPVMPAGTEMVDNATIQYIGIEDWLDSNNKGDFNDLVLVVVGKPDAPVNGSIDNESNYQVQTFSSKRYFIEDLGSIGDFDFNDIVVDVKDIRTEYRKATFNNNGVLVSDNVTNTENRQKAVIRAMGGTKDFTLKIGNTTWKKSDKFTVSTMYNTSNPNFEDNLYEFDVQGWNYNKNNVSVTVDGNESKVITFPETGKVPMMVAGDITKTWSKEKESVTNEWFK